MLSYVSNVLEQRRCHVIPAAKSAARGACSVESIIHEGGINSTRPAAVFATHRRSLTAVQLLKPRLQGMTTAAADDDDVMLMRRIDRSTDRQQRRAGLALTCRKRGAHVQLHDRRNGDLRRPIAEVWPFRR